MWDLPDGNISFIVPRESGGYVVSNYSKLCHFDWGSQEVKPFLTADPDKPGNRFNDGKCDSHGRLFAGLYLLLFYAFCNFCLAMLLFQANGEDGDRGKLWRKEMKDLSEDAASSQSK